MLVAATTERTEPPSLVHLAGRAKTSSILARISTHSEHQIRLCEPPITPWTTKRTFIRITIMLL